MTTAGISISDTLCFFVGDGPARNLERGVQQGGAIWCGAYGIQTSMTSDLAHALTLKWRTLQEQRDVIIAGKFGKRHILKPLDNLYKAELQLELAQVVKHGYHNHFYCICRIRVLKISGYVLIRHMKWRDGVHFPKEEDNVMTRGGETLGGTGYRRWG